MSDKILCPTGFYVTKEECDMCGQCRPSRWEQDKEQEHDKK